ncbi:MAG: HAMP domain-containing histidine kinase [Flavobacteriia bacterium]|nr:HAMP domain-containing histidine kinase [Flavobacteriia bacterium]
MKKIRVNAVILAVIVAMLALLVIQALQMAQLYDRKSTEFKSKVKTTLERIAIRHEKAEDIRKYLHIVNHDFSGQYKDILKKEFQDLLSVQESISIRDTIVYEKGIKQNYLVIRGKSFDTLSGLTAEHKVLARDVREVRDLFNRSSQKIVSSDTSKISIHLNQRVMQQIFKKAKFVNDMLIEAFRSNIYTNPSERVDIEFLDSVIYHEMKDDNLPTDYLFMLTDNENEPYCYKMKLHNYRGCLDSTKTFKVALFPSNTLDDTLYLKVYFPSKGSFLLKTMGKPLVISFALMVLIAVSMSYMFRTILTQKKLSDLKNDFVSNMTHEFKTPISTISLACEAMNDSDMMAGGVDAVKPFVKMIQDENKRLSLLVEQILQSAVLERGELKLKKEKVLMNEVLHEITLHARLRVKGIGGQIHLDIPQQLIEITTDKMHFTNLVTNLVDNGIKYSDGVPDITIQLAKEGNYYILSVTDKGIGIKKEHITKIFDKLYRVPTGNLHNVKGFGLGLSYVKAIAEIQGWDINVRSVIGEGTTFKIKIKEEK